MSADPTELTGEQPLLDALAQARPAAPPDSGLARRIDLQLVQRAITGGPAPTLGRFELEARLGEGGLGVVYRARDPVLHRAVAVKLLRERGTLRRGLEQEARALARLDHPNVVRVFDLGEQDWCSPLRERTPPGEAKHNAEAHKWELGARFRRHVFGWKSHHGGPTS